MDKEKTEKHYEQIREKGYKPLVTLHDGRVACSREGVKYIYVPSLDKFLDTGDK